VKGLPGKPDIVFVGPRVAVYCDGDFWHGRNWDKLRSKLRMGANAEYWCAKIESNIERDLHNQRLLEEAGWHVLRLWETDILRDIIGIALTIKEVIDMRKGRDGRENRTHIGRVRG
jgi:DNA mismatch endonuclease (patch repair protein)